MEVNKRLSPYGLQLYLYLAANSNNYQFALSPAAAEEYAGIKKTSFHKYMRLLEIEGYIVWRHGNVYDFYTTPRDADERTHPDNHSDSISFDEFPFANQECEVKLRLTTKAYRLTIGLVRHPIEK